MRYECEKIDVCLILQQVREENAELIRIFQIATIEFEKKNKTIDGLKLEISKKDAIIKDLQKENEKLKQELEREQAKVRLLTQMIYGSKHKEETSTLEKTEVVEYKGQYVEYKVNKTRRGAQEGHKGHGRKLPKNLPVEEVLIDLPEDKKACEYCGEPFVETELRNISTRISFKKLY